MSRADACTALVARDQALANLVFMHGMPIYDQLLSDYAKYNDQLSERAPEPMRGYVKDLRGREELILSDPNANPYDAKSVAPQVADLHGFDRNIFCSS